MNKELIKINILNTKGTILKKINISYIVHFNGKYRFSLNSFWNVLCSDLNSGDLKKKKNLFQKGLSK